MKPRIDLYVKPNQAAKFKKGYPLVRADDITNTVALNHEGSIFVLRDQDHHFLGKGYYGLQNKGVGWILSHDHKENIDEAFFKNKLTKAIQKRKSFYRDSNTTAFRVFNGEGDGIGGITIDYFSGYYLINWYSAGIYSFHSIIIQCLSALEDCQGIYQKRRYDTKGQYIDEDDFVTGERGDFPIIVQENGMNYAVDLNDGAMVGIFLDQRDIRKAIRDKYAKRKTVLNMFSYTGAFSVAAASGKASKTTSVDLAKRSRPKTEEQFRVNDIDADGQDIIVMDVFDYFKYAKRKNLTYDLVILDPPSFARSKKRTFSAANDYPALIKDTIPITTNNGMIVASTNNATVSMKKFRRFIDKAFSEMGREYHIVESYSLPADFATTKSYPEGNYLKVCMIQLVD